MGDKIDPKAKEKSEAINTKIKWPFAIFFLIAIFVATSFVARVNQDKFNDLYTPALYLFSTIAQTMGALLGISLAVLYTIVSSIKATIEMPALEPSKRLVMKDEYLKRSIVFGLISILLAIIAIMSILLAPNFPRVFYPFLILIAIVDLFLSVYSVYSIIIFLFYRFRFYYLPNELLKLNILRNGNIRRFDKIDSYEYAEICIMLESIGISNKFTKQSLSLIELAHGEISYQHIFELYEKLFDDLRNLYDENKYIHFKNDLMHEFISTIIDFINSRDPCNAIYIYSAMLTLIRKHLRYTIDIIEINYYFRMLCLLLNLNKHFTTDNLDKIGIKIFSLLFGWLKCIIKLDSYKIEALSFIITFDFIPFRQPAFLRQIKDFINSNIIKDKTIISTIINYQYIELYIRYLYLYNCFSELKKINYKSEASTDIFKNIFRLSTLDMHKIDHSLIEQIMNDLKGYYDDKIMIMLMFILNLKPLQIFIDDPLMFGRFLPIEELRYIFAKNDKYYSTDEFINIEVKKYCNNVLDIDKVKIGIIEKRSQKDNEKFSRNIIEDCFHEISQKIDP